LARKIKRRPLNRKARISIKRTRWILGIPTSAKDWRGLQAEQKIFQSLEYHQRKKTEFPKGRKIREFTPVLHFSRDDREGKDIIAKFQVEFQPDSETLPIQVQNWWSREAENEFREKGICLIAVWPEEDEKKARERTFDAISKWFLRVVEEEVSSIS
jgi:hypothetical protein